MEDSQYWFCFTGELLFYVYVMKPEHTISYTDRIAVPNNGAARAELPTATMLDGNISHNAKTHWSQLTNFPFVTGTMTVSAAHRDRESSLINDACWRIAENIDTIIIQYINLIKAT